MHESEIEPRESQDANNLQDQIARYEELIERARASNMTPEELSWAEEKSEGNDRYEEEVDNKLAFGEYNQPNE